MLRTDQALGQHAESLSPLVGQERVSGGKRSFSLVPLIAAGRGCLRGEMGFVLDHHPKIRDFLRAATAEAVHYFLEGEVVEKGEISSVEDSCVILQSQVSPIKCHGGWEET